jgi:glycerate kinase
VLVAPDSFKGSMTAPAAADAIAAGWRRERPSDDVVVLPMADGGEGTLDAVLRSSAARVHRTPVLLGQCRHEARWLLLEDGEHALVELAECCGLPLCGTGDPMGAGTEAVGTVLTAALQAGARRITVAIGGSAATDGGAGCLRQLGLQVLDGSGAPVRSGGGGLLHAATVERSGLRPAPSGGVRLLCDVDAPLFGPRGAAHVFAAQKGASPEQVDMLDVALRRWYRLSGGDASLPGAGAAGGFGYGLGTYWAADLVPGARTVAELVGLDDELADADLVITGEGRFDRQSLGGKAPGLVLERARARGIPAAVIAGSVTDTPSVPSYGLADLAGDVAEALADPDGWAAEAAARLARSL